MKPDYVAKKSMAKAFTPLCVLLFWLIVPTLIIVVRVLKLKSETVEFYGDHVIHKYGILSKNEDRKPFFKVNGVSIKQSLWGQLFGYGDLYVDGTGRWDFSLEGVKNPRELKTFLETRAATAEDFQSIVRE